MGLEEAAVGEDALHAPLVVEQHGVGRVAGVEAAEWSDLKKLALSLNWSLPS